MLGMDNQITGIVFPSVQYYIVYYYLQWITAFSMLSGMGNNFYITTTMV